MRTPGRAQARAFVRAWTHGRIMTGVVRVWAPARLHMGFLDLGGTHGRRFGGLGLTLDGLGVQLTARPATAVRASGPQAARAERYVREYLDHMRAPRAVAIEVQQAIPEHIGLGSGTQLALAVGVALARVLDYDADARKVAALHERGQRSGIGVAAFETGGFILDGGKGADDAPPPAIARLPFPRDWRVMLVFDDAQSGLHGERESGAFAALTPWSADTAAHLCHELLLRTLPALAEADLHNFGHGIAALQRVVGDHFAPAQGGRFTSARVAQALRWLEERGVAGVGQSSWGPTGFGIIGSPVQADALRSEAQALWPARSGLRFEVLRGRNQGAEIVVSDA